MGKLSELRAHFAFFLNSEALEVCFQHGRGRQLDRQQTEERLGLSIPNSTRAYLDERLTKLYLPDQVHAADLIDAIRDNENLQNLIEDFKSKANDVSLTCSTK